MTAWTELIDALERVSAGRDAVTPVTTAAVARRYPGTYRAGPLRVRNQYDGATTGRRASQWPTLTLGPNAATLPNLATLRARARGAMRNDAYARRAISHRVSQMVGGGIQPRSLAPDPAFRTEVRTLWTRWASQCDADGQLDFAGLLTQGATCWQEAGEVFVRLRSRRPEDGLVVPLQLQMLEPELCPLEHTALAPNGHTIRAGIERSPIGARVRYWFYRAHPADGDLTLDAGMLIPLPAAAVLHWYLPERAGQLRGTPHLTTALLTLRDLDVGMDATLLRWQLGNMFMGSIERAAGVDVAAVDPFTGAPVTADAQGLPIVAMKPGAVVDLLPGEELKFNDPPEVGQTFEAFVQHVGRRIAAATGTPYHALTGDMGQVNDRTIRVILQDFRRELEALIWSVLIHKFCQPVWTEWFHVAIQSGALRTPAGYWADVAAWQAVEWAPDRWGYIHPVQDVEADVAEIRAGLASRTDKIEARGSDAEEIDRQRAEDQARDEALGLVSDSNPKQVSQAGLAQDPEPGERTEGERTGDARR